MSAMTREEMLRHLSNHGESAGSDFNDSEDIHGWFGWAVDIIDQAPGEAVLSVTYNDADDGTGQELTLRWRMVPMGLPPRPFQPAQQPVVVDFPEGGFPR